jgi:alkylhydroperoxidase family enzyme
VLQAVSFGVVKRQRDYQLQAWRMNTLYLAVRAAIKLSDAATLTGRGLLSAPVVNKFSLCYFTGIPIASDFSAAHGDSLMVKKSQNLCLCL